VVSDKESVNSVMQLMSAVTILSLILRLFNDVLN